MIWSLSGRVTAIEAAGVVVDVQGVGYLVHVPVGMLATLTVGQELTVPTQLIVREDAMTLYGFPSPEHRSIFTDLVSVTGVGPKLGLVILSALQPDQLRLAIASGDLDALTSIPGIGKRSAQRIVMELKDRLGVNIDLAIDPSTKLADVRDALVGLGYTPGELREVLDRLQEHPGDVEELVKSALKDLAKV